MSLNLFKHLKINAMIIYVQSDLCTLFLYFSIFVHFLCKLCSYWNLFDSVTLNLIAKQAQAPTEWIKLIITHENGSPPGEQEGLFLL